MSQQQMSTKTGTATSKAKTKVVQTEQKEKQPDEANNSKPYLMELPEQPELPIQQTEIELKTVRSRDLQAAFRTRQDGIKFARQSAALKGCIMPQRPPFQRQGEDEDDILEDEDDPPKVETHASEL